MAETTWQKDVIMSFIVLCEDHGDVLNLALALRLSAEGQAATLRAFLGARTYNRIAKEQAAKVVPHNKNASAFKAAHTAGEWAALAPALRARVERAIAKGTAFHWEPKSRCRSCGERAASTNGQCVGCAHKYQFGDRGLSA
jgi:hypothetical protein